MRNLIFGVNSVTASDLIRYDSLLQNVADVITKWDSYFITKCERSLLQNASGFLLQSGKVLLQNATAITKYNVYYKLQQYTDALKTTLGGLRYFEMTLPLLQVLQKSLPIPLSLCYIQ